MIPPFLLFRIELFHVIQAETRKATILKTTTAVYANGLVTFPYTPRVCVVKVAGGRMTEDQHIALGDGLRFIPSVPYCKLTAVFIVFAIPVSRHIVFLGRGMDELIFDSIDFDIDVGRQFPYEVKDIRSGVLAIMLELLMGNHATVSIPMPSLTPICVFFFLGCILAMTDGLEHHILVIADQHPGVGHLHNSS